MEKKLKRHHLQNQFIKRRCEFQIGKINALAEMLSIVEYQIGQNKNLSTLPTIVEIIQNQIQDRCKRIQRFIDDQTESTGSS